MSRYFNFANLKDEEAVGFEINLFSHCGVFDAQEELELTCICGLYQLA